MSSNTINSPLIFLLVLSLILSLLPSFYSISNQPIVYFFDDIPTSLNPIVTFDIKSKIGEPENSETLTHQGSYFTLYGDITHHTHICVFGWNNLTALVEAYDPFKSSNIK